MNTKVKKSRISQDERNQILLYNIKHSLVQLRAKGWLDVPHLHERSKTMTYMYSGEAPLIRTPLLV